jgi:hypothetical protein
VRPQRLPRAVDGTGVDLAENLRSNHKGFNSPEHYARVVERLHAHGIALQGCFVFGLDGDGPEVFRETAEFAVAARIDLPRFAVVTPFPNTPLFRRLEAEGRILTRDWELYDAQHVVFQPARMSVQELQEGTEAAWKHAYSLRSIVRRLRHSPAPWPVRLGTNLGYRFYAHNLSRYYNCDWIIGTRRRERRPRPGPNRWRPADEADAGSSLHRAAPRRSSYIRTWQMEPLPRPRWRDSRRATSPCGSTTTGSSRSRSTNPPTSSPSASKPTPPNAPTRSPAPTAAAACPW